MGVIDAPQWLLPAFVRSARALGAGADNERIEASCEALIRLWSTPERRFHNLRHVIDMLARVDELAAESHNPDVIRVATWYHGCVFSLELRETYQRNGGEDEVASAAEAARDLTALGVPQATVERICELILSLKRHNLADSDIDAMALNDADLGTLACGPQLYKTYRQQVRAEYEHIPDLDYYRARRVIIEKLLSREKLFSSPLGMRWELPARENLRYELRLIDAELAGLEAPSTPPAPRRRRCPSRQTPRCRRRRPRAPRPLRPRCHSVTPPRPPPLLGGVLMVRTLTRWILSTPSPPPPCRRPRHLSLPRLHRPLPPRPAPPLEAP